MMMNSQSFQAVSVVVSLLAGRAPVVYAEVPIEACLRHHEDVVLLAVPASRNVAAAPTPVFPRRVDDEDEDPERWDGLS